MPKKTATKNAKARAQRELGSIAEPAAVKIVQKREFMDRVATAAGLKKTEVRDVVEATMAELGKAFTAGESLSVEPFGKARVNRQKDINGAEVIILRLRRKLKEADQTDGRPARHGTGQDTRRVQGPGQKGQKSVGSAQRGGRKSTV